MSASPWLAIARETLRLSPPRTMRRWLEDEMVLPDGPRRGRTFTTATAPWTELLLAEYESTRWRRFFIAGSVQSGKTLLGFIAPTLYTLFERQEDCIIGVPVIDLAQGIWEQRLRPVIERTQYARWLPDKGPGSRRGRVRDYISFGNGATLRFMGAGGGDEQRSSYPARVVVLTELDKMDTPGQVSRETDPTRQIEARTTSFGDAARIYGECTVSVPEGKVWREVHLVGSGTRIFLPCPHCGRHLHPERERLVGWDAPTVGAAVRGVGYACQHCDAVWTEADRQEALRHPRLVHKPADATPDAWPPKGIDERAPAETDAPELPDTETFGLQYSMFASGLLTMGDIARRMWQAAQMQRIEDEREIAQFVWTTPYTDTPDGEEPLTPSFIIGHAAGYPLGQTPPESDFSVCAIDVQKFWVYVMVCAFSETWQPDDAAPDADDDDAPALRVLTTWVADWATIDIVPREHRDSTEPTKGMVRAALDEAAALGAAHDARSTWVDINYDLQGWVAEWAAEDAARHALRGRGHKQMERFQLSGKALTSRLWRVGDGRLMQARRQTDRSVVWFIDADSMRLAVHAALRAPLGRSGCMFFPDEIQRRTDQWVAKHLCNEQFVPRRKPGRGIERTWVNTGRHDMLDCAGYARAGALYEIAQQGAARRPATPAAEADWTKRKVKR